MRPHGVAATIIVICCKPQHNTFRVARLHFLLYQQLDLPKMTCSTTYEPCDERNKRRHDTVFVDFYTCMHGQGALAAQFRPVQQMVSDLGSETMGKSAKERLDPRILPESCKYTEHKPKTIK